MMKLKILLIVIICTSFNSIIAQNDSNDSSKRIPQLNGHKFLSTSQIKSTFISTNLQTDIGIGMTSLINIPGVIIGDSELLNFQGKIMFADFNLRYQQKITSWLALFATMKMSGRVGADLSTIVADGINTVSGGDIGWLIKLKETERFQLSATIKVNNIVGSFIDVKQYIKEIIEEVPYPSLTEKIPASSIGIGFRSAYAFNPSYGLQLNIDITHGESLQRGATDNYYSLGILGDIDFNPKYNVPLALALGYSLSSTPEVSMNNSGFSNIFLAKFGYSGSDDYELGLQLSRYNTRLKSIDSTTSITKIMLGLKFYF